MPGYCSPETDKLIQESRTELSTAKRSQIYEQAAALIRKERPIVYLYHRHWLWAYTSKLAASRPCRTGWCASPACG